ncbi:MAG: hypothetical protein M3501_02250, partial [Actinomycetota bacterium]|nr:hypothetical protein [Actinomycetota bacterium]
PLWLLSVRLTTGRRSSDALPMAGEWRHDTDAVAALNMVRDEIGCHQASEWCGSLHLPLR